MFSTQATAVTVSAAAPVTVVVEPAMLVADTVAVVYTTGSTIPEAATGRAGMEADLLPVVLHVERKRGKEREGEKKRNEK